jgi:hypothetical protein
MYVPVILPKNILRSISRTWQYWRVFIELETLKKMRRIKVDYIANDDYIDDGDYIDNAF